MHNNLQLVVHKRLKVEVADLHDDLEGNEVHDAMLNGVLQGEHVEVDAFCCESHNNLNQSDNKRNFRATFNEHFVLIVSELHEVHSFGNLWIKAEMKSNSTWELDVENGEGMRNGWGVVSILVGHDGVVHAEEHRNNNESNQECRVKVLALLLR